MKFYEKYRESLFLDQSLRKKVKDIWYRDYKDKGSKNDMMTEWIEDKVDIIERLDNLS